MDSTDSPCHSLSMRPFFVVAFVAAACSSAPQSGRVEGTGGTSTEIGLGGSGGTSASTTGSPATGTYRVPVADVSLAPEATFAVAVKVQAVQGGLELHYDLPTELVGVPFQSVKLQVLDTMTQLTIGGDVGQASCTQVGLQITCNETLPLVSVDLEAVRALAVAAGLAPTAVEQRVAVAVAFSIDPIGVFDVLVPSSGSKGGPGP